MLFKRLSFAFITAASAAPTPDLTNASNPSNFIFRGEVTHRAPSEASCLPKEDGSSTFAAWLTPRLIGLSPDDQSSWCDDWFGVETASRITRPVGNPEPSDTIQIEDVYTGDYGAQCGQAFEEDGTSRSAYLYLPEAPADLATGRSPLVVWFYPGNAGEYTRMGGSSSRWTYDAGAGSERKLECCRKTDMFGKCTHWDTAGCQWGQDVLATLLAKYAVLTIAASYGDCYYPADFVTRTRTGSYTSPSSKLDSQGWNHGTCFWDTADGQRVDQSFLRQLGAYLQENHAGSLDFKHIVVGGGSAGAVMASRAVQSLDEVWSPAGARVVGAALLESQSYQCYAYENPPPSNDMTVHAQKAFGACLEPDESHGCCPGGFTEARYFGQDVRRHVPTLVSNEPHDRYAPPDGAEHYFDEIATHAADAVAAVRLQGGCKGMHDIDPRCGAVNPTINFIHGVLSGEINNALE